MPEKVCWQGVRALERILVCDVLIVFVRHLCWFLIPSCVFFFLFLQFFSSNLHLT